MGFDNNYVMEFSETLELRRIAKYKNDKGECSPFSKLVKTWSQLKPNGKNPISQVYFKHAPSLSSRSAREFIKSPSNQDDDESDFKIVKDNSYLEKVKDEKKSTLAISLSNTEEVPKIIPINQIVLDVYFFQTRNKVTLSLPDEITVDDMISRALQSYSKTKYPPLPHGINSDAYEVWLPEDDNIFPDTDYAIDKTASVASLGVSTLCICDIPDYRSSIYNSKRGTNVVKIPSKSGLLHVKFIYENRWAVLALNPESHLSEVLIQLWKKFLIIGDLSVKMFEFRVFIEEGGYECALDMSLKIKELPKQDIRLYRKILADTPKNLGHRGHKSLQIFFNAKNFK